MADPAMQPITTFTEERPADADANIVFTEEQSADADAITASTEEQAADANAAEVGTWIPCILYISYNM